MERYTYFDGGKWRLKIGDTEYSGDWVERLAAYEETGLEPEELAQAQAKKKGRLVVLPCDVGDKLYDVTLGEVREKIVISLSMLLCALPGFVDSKNEEKTERNAGYLVVSHSGGGMLRQGTRKGIRRTPANRGMRAHWVVKGLDISEDVCHGMCP